MYFAKDHDMLKKRVKIKKKKKKKKNCKKITTNTNRKLIYKEKSMKLFFA